MHSRLVRGYIALFWGSLLIVETAELIKVKLDVAKEGDGTIKEVKSNVSSLVISFAIYS